MLTVYCPSIAPFGHPIFLRLPTGPQGAVGQAAPFGPKGPWADLTTLRGSRLGEYSGAPPGAPETGTMEAPKMLSSLREDEAALAVGACEALLRWAANALSWVDVTGTKRKSRSRFRDEWLVNRRPNLTPDRRPI